MRQELSFTHLLLATLSRGASEIVTRSTVQNMIKQTNDFTKEKMVNPVRV
jgi:hypothetical protein